MELLALYILFAALPLGTIIVYMLLRSAHTQSLRWLTLVCFCALLLATYIGGERILGNARPLSAERYLAEADYRTLYVQAIQNKGIYLLLATEDTHVYYSLPLDKETAQALRRALEESRRNQSPLMFRFRRSWESREPMFYAMPQPAPPPKDEQERGMEYNDQEWRI